MSPTKAVKIFDVIYNADGTIEVPFRSDVFPSGLIGDATGGLIFASKEDMATRIREVASTLTDEQMVLMLLGATFLKNDPTLSAAKKAFAKDKILSIDVTGSTAAISVLA